LIFSSSRLYAEDLAKGEIDKEAKPMSLESGSGWQLESLINSENKEVSVLQDTAITILFENGRISGKSGCNRYFGDYKRNGNDLSIGKAASTMMACPEPIMMQERDYLEQLSKVKSYSIENEVLQLRNATGDSVLVFAALRSPSLQGVSWQLGSFNSGNALLSNTVTENITAVFDENGRLSGFAGCNQFSCSFKINGDKMELSPIMTTRKYCESPENVMETEAGFISALEATVRYRIQNEELTLLNDEDKPAVIFRKSKEW